MNKSESQKQIDKFIPKLYTVQSNDFIRRTIYKHFTLNDLKLFKLIVSKVNFNDTLFDESYTLNYRELDKIGVNSSNRYNIVSMSLKKLAAYYVNFKNLSGDQIEVGLIKNKFIFKQNTGQIIIEIHDDLKPFLLQLDSKYTSYEVENIKEFKSIYAIKTYELLKSWSNDRKTEENQYITTVKNFREYLELKETDYPRYSNFKQRIIQKVIQEINEHADITIKINEIKSGRKVDKLIFIISKRFNKKVITNDDILLTEIDLEFTPDEDSIKHAINKGYKESGISIIVNDFIKHYLKKQELMANWQAAFKLYVNRRKEFGINS